MANENITKKDISDGIDSLSKIFTINAEDKEETDIANEILSLWESSKNKIFPFW